MNAPRHLGKLALFIILGICICERAAVAQTVREDDPTYFNVSGSGRSDLSSTAPSSQRFGPLPESDGTSISALAQSALSSSQSGVMAGSGSEAGVSAVVEVSGGESGTAFASWSGQIHNDSSLSRALVVDLFVFTDSTSGRSPSASATLGGTRYAGLVGYPGEYLLNGGVLAPGAFIDFKMVAFSQAPAADIGFSRVELSVLGLEWTPSAVPELPPMALLSAGLAALAVCRRVRPGRTTATSPG